MSIKEEIPDFFNIAVEQAKSRNEQDILQRKFTKRPGCLVNKIWKTKLGQYNWKRKYYSLRRKCKRLENENKHLKRLLSGSSMVANQLGNDQQPRVMPTKELSRDGVSIKDVNSQSRKENQANQVE